MNRFKIKTLTYENKFPVEIKLLKQKLKDKNRLNYLVINQNLDNDVFGKF